METLAEVPTDSDFLISIKFEHLFTLGPKLVKLGYRWGFDNDRNEPKIWFWQDNMRYEILLE